jgi:hypothetical protein
MSKCGVETRDDVGAMLHESPEFLLVEIGGGCRVPLGGNPGFQVVDPGLKSLDLGGKLGLGFRSHRACS